MLDHSFGYTPAISQLLTIPPYIIASGIPGEFIYIRQLTNLPSNHSSDLGSLLG